MMVLSENGTTYMAYSPNCMCNDWHSWGLRESDFTLEENLFFWKVKEFDNCIMMVYCETSLRDALQYCEDLFDEGETLSKEYIFNKVLPKIQQMMMETRGDKNDECKIVIAQNDNIFLIDSGIVEKVKKCDFCIFVDEQRGTYEKYKDLPPLEIFKKECEEIEYVNDIKMFPLVVMDTKTEKVQVIKRSECL